MAEWRLVVLIIPLNINFGINLRDLRINKSNDTAIIGSGCNNHPPEAGDGPVRVQTWSQVPHLPQPIRWHHVCCRGG